MQNEVEFSRDEALAMWARLVAGHAACLDDTGARTLMDGIHTPGGPDRGGSYEGVTRMMHGWGGWLSQPGRPAAVTWRGASHDVAALMRQAVLAGCDPSHRGYWGNNPAGPNGWDQRTVEAGHTMFVLWQSRHVIWDVLTPGERTMISRYHERFGERPDRWENNWALFWALNHAGRAALGAPHDAALIQDVLTRYLDGVYCGDGWYDDAATRGAQQFDDYNLWVFAAYVLMWAEMPVSSGSPETRVLRATLLERVGALMAHVPYFFGADGQYAHYGRSLAYKFGRLGAPLRAYKLGAWPHSAGMLKRLVGRHLRWHFDRGAVDARGVLRQAITIEGSPEVRETYIATGSQYWAMQTFGALWSLPDDDPLWSTPEEPLPVERGDFVKVFAAPGWVVAGTGATGHVSRFNAGSTHQPPNDMAAKYDKLVYGTAAGFNTGTINGAPAPDAALCLTAGATIAHRRGNDAFAVGILDGPLPASLPGIGGWLRMLYRLRIGGAEHKVDTSILVLGETHLRAHRIVLSDASNAVIGAVEGAAALGYSPGMVPQTGQGPLAAQMSLTPGQDRTKLGRKVAIRAIRGYDRVSLVQEWHGRHDLHSEHAHFGMPLLHVDALQPVHELVCAVHIGQLDATRSRDLIDGVASATWAADGTLEVRWRDATVLRVPALTRADRQAND